jgi:two-component system sensor histidine kinase VicK
MFRSLNVKLVLIFIVFIISVMSVVGVFLLDRVSAFYADDFLNQMDEGFSERLKETLSGCFDSENPAVAQKEIMTAYSAAFSFDNYRNFYILDMEGRVLDGSAEAGQRVTKTSNLLAAMNRKNEHNRV